MDSTSYEYFIHVSFDDVDRSPIQLIPTIQSMHMCDMRCTPIHYPQSTYSIFRVQYSYGK